LKSFAKVKLSCAHINRSVGSAVVGQVQAALAIGCAMLCYVTPKERLGLWWGRPCEPESLQGTVAWRNHAGCGGL